MQLYAKTQNGQQNHKQVQQAFKDFCHSLPDLHVVPFSPSPNWSVFKTPYISGPALNENIRRTFLMLRLLPESSSTSSESSISVESQNEIKPFRQYCEIALQHKMSVALVDSSAPTLSTMRDDDRFFPLSYGRCFEMAAFNSVYAAYPPWTSSTPKPDFDAQQTDEIIEEFFQSADQKKQYFQATPSELALPQFLREDIQEFLVQVGWRPPTSDLVQFDLLTFFSSRGDVTGFRCQVQPQHFDDFDKETGTSQHYEAAMYYLSWFLPDCYPLFRAN